MKNVNNEIDEAISYLVVKLGKERFALHVREVINIHPFDKITRVPLAPDYMKGIVNLWGAALPVIDTNIKLGLGETVLTGKTCLIVINLFMDGSEVKIGALVDSVEEVVEIEDTMIGPPPSIGKSYVSTFISGIAKLEAEFVMILDYLKLFTISEVKSVMDMYTEISTASE